MSDYIRVVIRCKPTGEEKAWKIDGDRLLLENVSNADESSKRDFTFDRIFTENSTHSDVYESIVKPHVDNFLQRTSSNLCVVSYGLPCTGKSHTVFGTSGQTRIKQEARGIILRCGKQLFEELQKSDYADSICRISVSFCHVFDDGRVADLFDTKKRNLDVVDSPSSFRCFVPNLTEQIVTSSQDVLRLVEKGYLMRNATGCSKEPTKKLAFISNAQPLQQYRPHCSHAVFTFNVEVHRREENEVYVSQISLVDLAGRGIEHIHSGMSQKTSDSGIEVLHRVISTTSEKGFSTASSLHSKSNLTKLLKHGLGGNCQTVFIGNVSLSESSVPLTRQCLEVLSSSRKVKNFTKVGGVPLAQAKLGMCLEDARSLKTSIAQELQVEEGEVKSLEIVTERSCIVNGSLYDDVNLLAQELLKKLANVESQLVHGGKPMQKRPHSAKAKRQPGHPLAMVRPLSLETSKTPVQKTVHVPSPSTRGRQTEGTPTPQTKLPLSTVKPAVSEQNVEDRKQETRQKENTSSESGSSLEDTDSNSEEDAVSTTPVVLGPPPPPLKDIPHINPESPVTSQVFPYASGGPTIPKRPLSASKERNPIHISVLPRPIRQPKLQFPSQSNVKQSQQLLLSDGDNQLSGVNGLTSLSQSRQLNQSPSPTAALPMVPVQTSTPKAKRNLFPEPASINDTQPSRSIPADNQQKTINPEAESMRTSVGANPAKSQKPPIFDAILVSSSRGVHEPVNANNPKGIIPPSNRKPPSGSSTGLRRKVHRRRRHRRPSVSSTEEETSSSSESLSSDSDSGLSDEARDTFDPRIQQRRLPLQPMPSIALSAAPALGGGIAPLPILPPISSQTTSSLIGNNSGVLPPLQGPGTVAHHLVSTNKLPSTLHQLKPLENPPTYQEASDTARKRNLPYTHSQGRNTNSRLQDQRVLDTNLNDLVQYVSNEEIHISAMEGVRHSQMKDLALQFGVDYRDHGGRTPLMYAVLGNQPKMCEVLLKLKASINAKDATGFTPLLWATFHAKPDVMKILLRNHNVDMTCCDTDRRSIYHWAMKTPNIQCLKWICKYDNSPYLVNHLDNEGLSPLHWAVMSDQASHIRLLLTSTSADVSIQDKEGRTPLNYAVLNYSPSCIRAILDQCESAVNLIDSKGRTALHYACAEGSSDCVRTLLSYHSCNLHCTDNKETSPLHWAAAANQVGLIQLLLRRGADRSHRDSSDKTPLDYAQQRGHTECVKILQTYGLRRPMSAISLASHSSLHGASLAPQALDDHGHVQLIRPKRKFSLSGESVTSFDRQPADGQAQEASSEEQHYQPVVETSEEGGEGERTQSVQPDQTARAMSTDGNEEWAESRQNEQVRASDHSNNRYTRPRWLSLLCGGCLGGRNNAVAPANST